MGMDINKTRSDDMAFSIERPFGTLSYFSNLVDPVTLNRNIGAVRRASGSVNDRAVFDYNIVGHTVLLCGVMRCLVGAAGSRDSLCAITSAVSRIITVSLPPGPACSLSTLLVFCGYRLAPTSSCLGRLPP